MRELERLRAETKTQRDLLRRTLRWLGVASGAMAAAHAVSGGTEKHFSYPLRDAVTDPLSLAREISAHIGERT